MRGLVLALVLLTACDAWSLSINSDGFIHVIIVGGDAYRPRDGYRIRVTRAGGESRVVPLPATGELRIDGAGSETVTLALLPPDGCAVAASPLTVTLEAAHPQGATFAVSCGPLAG